MRPESEYKARIWKQAFCSVCREGNCIVWKTDHVGKIKKKVPERELIWLLPAAWGSRVLIKIHTQNFPNRFHRFVLLRGDLAMWKIHCCAEQNSFLLKSRADESHKETEGFIYSQDTIVPVN